MIKKIFFIFIALMSMITSNAQSVNDPVKSAKETAKSKKSAAKARKDLEKEFGIKHDKKNFITTEQIYVFGINYSPIDSTVYFTDQMILKNVKLEKKTEFLQFRNLYSKQLSEYMDGRGELNRVSCVVYDKNINNLGKKYRKIMNRYQKKNYQVKAIDQKEFQFNILKDGE